MLNRLRIRTKLTLVVAISLLALALVSVLGYSTVQSVKIGSPIQSEVQKHNDLRADTSPGLATINQPFLLLQIVAVEREPVKLEQYINELVALHDQYEQHVADWEARLSGKEGKARLVLDGFTYTVPSARRFWDLTFQSFVPAIQLGDRQKAAQLTAGPIRDAWLEHNAQMRQFTKANDEYFAERQAASGTLVAQRIPLMIGGAVALGLLMLLLSLRITRSIRQQLDALRRAARTTAERELPETVQAIDEQDPDAPLPVLEPLSVRSRDEIGDLARAFESVRQTAVDLAGRQAASRRAVAEMFVNLGRRNQALINRQLSFIDALERNEEDAEVLDDLFRLDHLATRMRRNAESLLVLAGAEQPRRWTDPIDVANVVRGALSEIEEYEQVRIQALDPAPVRGAAVADLSHLLAELLENATAFSPPTAEVVVVGARTDDGGYALSIVDQGIGMDADALAAANERLHAVTRFDVAPSKVLGLYVVGRLATRYGIDVRLLESPGRGVTARVHLPASLIEDAPAAAPGVAPAVAGAVPADLAPVAPVAPATAAHAIDDALARLTAVALPARSATPAAGASAPVTAASPPVPSDAAVPRRSRLTAAPAASPASLAEPAAAASAGSAGSDGAAGAAGPAWRDDLLAPFPGEPAGFSSPFATDTFADAAVTGTVPGHAARGAWPSEGAPAWRAPVPVPVAPPEPVRTRVDQLGGLPPPAPEPAPPAPTSLAAPARPQPAPAPATASPVPAAPPSLSSPAAGTSRDTAPSAGVTPGGLVRRVRGAQLPDTGPAREEAPPETRSPEEVRALLNRFRLGVEQGQLRSHTGNSSFGSEGGNGS